jgi:DNA-binding transcriptional regulator YiaG
MARQTAMTPKQVRDARKSTGLKPAQFAALLGVDRNTVVRWEMDSDSEHARGVSVPMAKLIQHVVAEQLRIRAQRKEDREKR